MSKDCDVCAENCLERAEEVIRYCDAMAEADGIGVDMPFRKNDRNAMATYLVGANMGVSPLLMKEALEHMTSMVEETILLKRKNIQYLMTVTMRRRLRWNLPLIFCSLRKEER